MHTTNYVHSVIRSASIYIKNHPDMVSAMAGYNDWIQNNDWELTDEECNIIFDYFVTSLKVNPYLKTAFNENMI